MRSMFEIRQEDNFLNNAVLREECETCEDAIVASCKFHHQYRALFDDLYDFFEETENPEPVVKALADMVRAYIEQTQ